MRVASGDFGHVCGSKKDKIEFYLCVEKQVGCTRMEGEIGSGTDISKHPTYTECTEQARRVDSWSF